MKNLIKSSLVSIALLATLASCGEKSISAKLTFTDGDEAADTALPIKTNATGSAYAWAMMQMVSASVEVKITGEKYVALAIDQGVEDKSNAMYFHCERKYEGAATLVSENVYKLAAPTSGSKTTAYGSSFAEYESVWGKQGTVTMEEDPTIADNFNPGTITFAEKSFTYVYDAIPE
ncbi:MAG: hypothetical protein IJ186_01625 [Bacilli bacterium]|nr:hypothetical protein [Bacilli bacterium]